MTSWHSVSRGLSLQRTAEPFEMRRPAGSTTCAGGRVSLHGVVDACATEELRETLVQHSRGGTESMVIDLSDVTFLDSSGVRLLYEVRGWSQGDVTFRIIASAGCRAEEVLRVAGLVGGAA